MQKQHSNPPRSVNKGTDQLISSSGSSITGNGSNKIDEYATENGSSSKDPSEYPRENENSDNESARLRCLPPLISSSSKTNVTDAVTSDTPFLFSNNYFASDVGAIFKKRNMLNDSETYAIRTGVEGAGVEN